MFEGFTQQTSAFLWELAFNNERPWFLAHKEEFERYLDRPFKALARDTAELMDLRWPEKDLRLHVSRIYRDARRLFGRGPYKDHLWFSLKSSQALLEGPMFWFEIGAADFGYGLGFYSATPAQMAAFRKKVDAEPARFRRLAQDVEADPAVKITGESYARPKGWQEDPVLSRWYSRKRIGMELGGDFGGPVLTGELPQILADKFSQLMPMYEFLVEVYRQEPAEPSRRR